MSGALNCESILREVLKRLYRLYGVQVLLIIGEELDEFIVEKLAIPWLVVDVIAPGVGKSEYENLRVRLEEKGLLIGSVLSSDAIHIETYAFLVIGSLTIEEVQDLISLKINRVQSKWIFNFLKYGKTVYYHSTDLEPSGCQTPEFARLLLTKIESLRKLGMMCLDPVPLWIDGVCDLKTLQSYGGKKVILSESSRLTPLAKDYLKQAEIEIIRK